MCFMKIFLFFLILTVYQTLHCQSKLKTWYVLFWSYYGPGRLDQYRTIMGCPQDVVCRLRNDRFKEILLFLQLWLILWNWIIKYCLLNYRSWIFPLEFIFEKKLPFSIYMMCILIYIFQVEYQDIHLILKLPDFTCNSSAWYF